jgi:hypothetical protein
MSEERGQRGRQAEVVDLEQRRRLRVARAAARRRGETAGTVVPLLRARGVSSLAMRRRRKGKR